jgi:ABC-type Fe3+/spermidine/putrescine transport system ATPase subunit
VATVELTGIVKTYGGHRAVDALSIGVASGERLALLGPSGCGKTTTLNMIAGFLEPDAGEIAIAGRPMRGIPAYRRDAGMVFQSYALFPHLSVHDNVAFGLVMRRVPRGEIAERVRAALELVRLVGLERRYPRELSGGQQQRVALARALVIRPAVLLLDEPLSNLDAKLRQEMRLEIVEIQRRLGITTIFVTHDQEEALAIADRVAVMRAGRVEQIDSPAGIYAAPRTAFVARFIGEGNFLPGRVTAVEAGRARVALDGGGQVLARGEGRRPGERVLAMVRLERVAVGARPAGLDNSFPAAVRGVSFLGAVTRLSLAAGDLTLGAAIHDAARLDGLASGTAVFAEWRAADCLLLDPEPAG